MNEDKMSDKDKYEWLVLLAYFSRLGFDYLKEKEWRDSSKEWKDINEWKEFKKFIKELKKKSKKSLKELEEIDRKLIISRELITEEAKKRKWDRAKLIDYFFDHKEELIKAPIPGQMSILDLKKFRPVSKIESLVPKSIFDISKKFNVTQLNKYDYVGTIEIEEYGEVENFYKWIKKDFGYLTKTDDFIEKMDKQLPKVNANLDKILKILIYLIQQEINKTGENIIVAKGSFYIKDIAKLLGYGEEIKLSGNVYKEIKRTLISGACIVYEYPHKIDGVNYKYYGSWYDLEVPEDNKHKWYYEFHGLYGREIIKFVNTGQVQYLKHQLKEIEDTTTTKKPYLHYFYNQMAYSNLSKKVGNLLGDMGIKKDKLNRPKECFKILKDCLIYFYPEKLEGFYISKYYHKPKTGLKDKLLISISEAFKKYEYEDFKEFLNARGIKDIRDAFIGFKKSHKSKYVKFMLTENDKELIKKIMEEAKEWEEAYNKIPFDEDQRYKFLSDCIRYLGHTKLSDLFSNANNMMEFLTKTLKGELRENKEEKLKLLK